ncbi:hypothetical protein GCM10023321_14800 [Pseudonocardia eucalypti]|uniref:DUF4386 family protein n=1 Tax=Pseudonocardia eucalypti TaxID=648755 RepID=A0ABP9PPH6_9PSEU|nr:hypothetical protein [Pseudonocardia eucalypti]
MVHTQLIAQPAADPVVSRGQQLACAWCGPLLILLIGGGLMVAGLWPPPEPSAGAEQIRAFYAENPVRVRGGLALMMAGMGLILLWGASITAQTSRIKTSSTALTFVQVAAFGVATIIGVASVISWGVASFRPDAVSAELTRAFSDLGWFFFVFDWSPLFAWYLAVGFAIFADRGGAPVFPRWAGYLSVWVALLSVPGGLMVFFKDGPLAFNGIFAIWIPLGVFFVWIIAMTALVIRAIDRAAD